MSDSFMKADKSLTRDLEKCQTSDEIRAVLENALTRSNIGERDPQTGQFVRRDPLTPAQQAAESDAPKQVTKTAVIGGRNMDFTGTEADVDAQIASDHKVAEALTPDEPITPRSVRPAYAKTQADRERDAYDKAQLDIAFRSGQLTTQEYLERTNAIGDYLAEQGFDVEAAANAQSQAGWAQATETFLQSEAGASWPGGVKNREVLGLELISLGLTDAQDKVAALAAAYESMKKKGLLFQSDVSPEQAIAMTDNATPQEILQAWKEKQGDPEAANQNFIQSFQGGRFFDKQ
ncbi:MAG: hypothetical protein LAO08_18450 [Acidobacteriia bacterium]|nr:hypothetical protein [Terriglobia bacterium]